MSWFAILKNDKSGFYYGRKYSIELPDELERMMEEADKNLSDWESKLRATAYGDVFNDKKYNDIREKYQKAKREHTKIKAEYNKKLGEQQVIARERQKGIAAENREAKKVKQDFAKKKNEVIQEYIKYINTFNVTGKDYITKLTDIGTTIPTGRIFGFILKKAYEDSGLKSALKEVIDYRNYKDYNVDKKINDFKNALENAKEFYKDDIRTYYLSKIRERNN